MLSRVGLVAIIGFVIGVAWPKLIGAKLGPDVPGSKKAATSVASKPDAAPSAASSPKDEDDEADGEETDKPSNQQRAQVAAMKLEGCRDKKNKKIEAGSDGCKTMSADRWISPRLKDLASCPAAIGLEGTMQLELDIDFDKKSLRVDQGAKSAFPSSTVRGVLKCAGAALEGVELDKIPHPAPRVFLLADVQFVPPGKSIEPEAKPDEKGADPEAAEAGLGTATVTWEKALLRDAPKDGKVVARVAQGSRLAILEQRDEWYLVKKGDAKGWVYRQAIGK